MCGIAGVISKSKVPAGTVEAMTAVIANRGPNGDGHLYQDTFAFGHRRLSIVDLSECGAQPMPYLDRYVITYNGEIYNHVEIRKELETQGYTFNSHTDTEVIMAAYDKWGVACLNRFNGMWAFAIYDSVKKEYFISRDRFGIKPLYYTQTHNGFIFGSEVKSLGMHPDVTLEPNIPYMKSFLASGAKDYLTETSFKGVFRLPPATYALGSAEDFASGKIKPHIFWSVTPNTAVEKFDQKRAEGFAKKYYDLLEDAVRLRLRADVKVGSALSGGLDSSSIVYLINRVLREQGKNELQETFSSVYKTKGAEACDESAYIDLLAKEFNVSTNQVEPQEREIPAFHERMIWAMETPPDNTGMSSWYTFSKVTQTKVVVTLDGQGADEQLGGYLHYVTAYLTSLSFIELYRESFAYWKIPGAKSYIFKGLLLGHIKALLGETLLKKLFKAVKKRDLKLNLNERLVEDLNSTLVTLIHYSDHISMAHSVESRMPFMDYRMIEFLASVPACYKMHNGWTKYLARLAFDGKIPDDICWRKDKMGWPMPEKLWYTGGLRNWAQASIAKSPLIAELHPHSKPLPGPDHELAEMIRYLNLSVVDKLFFHPEAEKGQ